MRLGIVQLTNFTALIGARRIEISQADITKCIGASVGLKRLFKKQFRYTIRVHRLAGNVFCDRNLRRFAINRTGGRENDLLDVGFQRRIQQREAAFYVVAEILLRIGYRFSDVGVSREVHDRLDPSQSGVQGLGIENIALDELEARRQMFVTRAEIIEDDNFVPGAPQRSRRMASDVSSTANDENNHSRYLSSLRSNAG